MKGLQGKVALVTGGSSGIGQAIAIRLGADGASVAINYVGRSEGAVSTKEAIEHGVEMCMKQVAEAGGRPILVGADVSDEQAVEQMFDRVMTEYGRLDILVNNAGIQIAEDSHELSAADFDKVLAVNLRGAFLCARQAVLAFLSAERPGVIVNVSSVHQVIPKPRFLGYSVSKGGMQNLTRSLALEYAARGIRVNGIGPGATVTPINRSWIDDPVKRGMVESHIPMRRAGDSTEMAAAVAFLCSDEAAYITGQTLFIDGGLTLYPSFETTWSSELPGYFRARISQAAEAKVIPSAPPWLVTVAVSASSARSRPVASRPSSIHPRRPVTKRCASPGSEPNHIGACSASNVTSEKPAAASRVLVRPGSARVNGPGAPRGRAGRSRPAASAAVSSRAHSLGPGPCQTSMTNRPPGRNARPMLVNAATGSPKNIVPVREIATSHDPAGKG
jgi:glucose 1-dehydrogenase